MNEQAPISQSIPHRNLLHLMMVYVRTCEVWMESKLRFLHFQAARQEFNRSLNESSQTVTAALLAQAKKSLKAASKALKSKDPGQDQASVPTKLAASTAPDAAHLAAASPYIPDKVAKSTLRPSALKWPKTFATQLAAPAPMYAEQSRAAELYAL